MQKPSTIHVHIFFKDPIHDRSLDPTKYRWYELQTKNNTSEPSVMCTARIPPPTPLGDKQYDMNVFEWSHTTK